MVRFNYLYTCVCECMLNLPYHLTDRTGLTCSLTGSQGLQKAAAAAPPTPAHCSVVPGGCWIPQGAGQNTWPALLTDAKIVSLDNLDISESGQARAPDAALGIGFRDQTSALIHSFPWYSLSTYDLSGTALDTLPDIRERAVSKRSTAPVPTELTALRLLKTGDLHLFFAWTSAQCAWSQAGPCVWFRLLVRGRHGAGVLRK